MIPIRSHIKILTSIALIAVFLILNGCPDPNARLFFLKKGKQVNEFKQDFDNGNVKIDLSGYRSFSFSNSMLVDLYVGIKMKDSTLFKWNDSFAKLLIDGQLARKYTYDYYPQFDNSHEAYITITFYVQFDSLKVQAIKVKRDITPKLALVLDSVIMWQGQPIRMDTILAFAKMPPSIKVNN